MKLSIYAAFDQPKPKKAKGACKCGGSCLCAQATDRQADMADLRPYPRHIGLMAVEANEETVAITWSDDTGGAFPSRLATRERSRSAITPSDVP